ncbi:MAG: hypothetical protein L7F77_11790 [Candidatus Magnetominusculus sp. LBB02]|nr:hypothetical protein [Candidatus Magnetominusculus sp. LBB02]
MKLLIIFDNSIGIDAIGIKEADTVELFPLSGDSDVAVETACAEISGRDGSVKTLNSAEMVHAEVEIIIEQIAKWSCNLGLHNVKGKTLRQWFALPGRSISTWWFGGIAEKNTFKTNLFFKAAQVNAVQKAVGASGSDIVIISLTDKDIAEAARSTAAKAGIACRLTLPKRTSIIRKLISHPMIAGILRWLDFAWRGVIARRYMGKLQPRLPDKPSALFITYFPSVEKASSGVFENKYAYALQQKMRAMEIPVLWGAMYVAINNYTFREAAALAAELVKNGEKIFFVEEFATASVLFEALCLWLRQILIGKYLFRFIKRALLRPPFNAENYSIALSLWRESFYGLPAIEGILNYLTYERLFKAVPNITKCIYFSEMHSWEMALNAAKPIGLPSIGFLHTTLSKREMNYLKDPGDFAHDFKCPMPDVVAGNGSHSYKLLRERGYSNVTILEAVRQLYLEAVLQTQFKPANQRPALLVVGTVDKAETIALLTLIDSAGLSPLPIWFKGHPSMPLEDLFKELGINIVQRGYTIKHGNIADCFAGTFAAVVPSSTVALEALAYGTEVIVPFFPNCMNTNPLCDFDGCFHKVTSKDELAEAVKTLLCGETLHSIEHYRQLIKDYWLLDGNLVKWTELLSQNNQGKKL